MIYRTILIFFEISVALVMFATLTAALATIGLDRITQTELLQRRAQWIRGGMLAALVFSVIMVCMLAWLGTFGEVFITGHALYALLLVGIPLVASIVTAGRRILKRNVDTSPQLVAPIRLLSAGAFLLFCFEFAVKPVPPYSAALVVLTLFFATLAAALYGWATHWQHKALRLGPEALPRWRKQHVLLATTATIVVAAGVFLAALQASRLPATYSMMDTMHMDMGGAQEGHQHTAHGAAARSVTDLQGKDIAGEPDVQVTLTAQENIITLSSGKKVDAWTYNGQAPGPTITARQGDLIEVRLHNQLSAEGVTIHWHGLDVPNAQDGVAGVTQNAVRPGEWFTYRFRAQQVGTFWYHTHQDSAVAVPKGLFGALVIQPREKQPDLQEVIVTAHTWQSQQGNVFAFGTGDTPAMQPIPAGTKVLLRLINTDSMPAEFALTGTPFVVSAIDGTEIKGGAAVQQQRIQLAAGGRYDVGFTMPDHAVQLHGVSIADDGTDEPLGPGTTLTLGDTSGIPVPDESYKKWPLFSPLHYGTPSANPFAGKRYDRNFTVTLDDRLGMFDGRVFFMPTINGAVMPDTPMHMVREGDIVKTTITSRGHIGHPMHIHGHHALVLSKNGVAASGAPWWVDSLMVMPGETYEIAYKADNPGIWMDHCHNLDHAVTGMVMHLGYEGITSPYLVGKHTENQPE